MYEYLLLVHTYKKSYIVPLGILLLIWIWNSIQQRPIRINVQNSAPTRNSINFRIASEQQKWRFYSTVSFISHKVISDRARIRLLASWVKICILILIGLTSQLRWNFRFKFMDSLKVFVKLLWLSCYMKRLLQCLTFKC